MAEDSATLEAISAKVDSVHRLMVRAYLAQDAGERENALARAIGQLGKIPIEDHGHFIGSLKALHHFSTDSFPDPVRIAAGDAALKICIMASDGWAASRFLHSQGEFAPPPSDPRETRGKAADRPIHHDETVRSFRNFEVLFHADCKSAMSSVRQSMGLPEPRKFAAQNGTATKTRA